MREGRDNGFLFDNNGLVALNLGADHVAEHEWGIKKTLIAFGIPQDENVFGLERRTVTKTSDKLRWHDGYDADMFVSGKRKKVRAVGLSFGLYDGYTMPAPRDNGLWTGWSDGDFAAVTVDSGVARLRDLYNAFQKRDIAIWLGGGGIFQNAGLVLGIASRLSKNTIAMWDKTDRERLQLKKDAAATGIEERLTRAGKRWYALSPSRQADGSISFWLNPMEQDQNNSARVTVADLDAWIAGTGPVPKTSARTSRKRA
jgi:hypothetical protein